MKLRNVTAVLLQQVGNRLAVKAVIPNPEVPSNGEPVFGPYLRQLLPVRTIAHRDGISIHKARDKRREQPEACLGDFPGQVPLGELIDGLPEPTFTLASVGGSLQVLDQEHLDKLLDVTRKGIKVYPYLPAKEAVEAAKRSRYLTAVSRNGRWVELENVA